MKNPTKSPALFYCVGCNRPHALQPDSPQNPPPEWLAPDLCVHCFALNQVQPHPGLTNAQTPQWWLDWLASGLEKTKLHPYRPNRIVFQNGQLSWAHKRSLSASVKCLAVMSESDYAKGLASAKWSRIEDSIRTLVKSGALS